MPSAPTRGASMRPFAYCLLLIWPLVAAAANAPYPNHGEVGSDTDLKIANHRFSSGETLPEARIHYRTVGLPRRDSTGRITNAVLLLHGAPEGGTQFLDPDFLEHLLGRDQTIDSFALYIIIPDRIGHGKSSKPSDGLRMNFPKYTCEDSVELQERLLAKLGVTHLRLVFGLGDGGREAWVWATTRPGFM